MLKKCLNRDIWVGFFLLSTLLFANDDALERAHAAYIEAFNHYTTLVTTPAKEGNVQKALADYRQKYSIYKRMKNAHHLPTKVPHEMVGLDASDIEGIEEISAPLPDTKVISVKPISSDFILAEKYRYGIGVAVNHDRAISLYQRALKRGDSCAMIALAEYYQEGIWLQRADTKAKGLLQKAAKAGLIEAQWQLEDFESEE